MPDLLEKHKALTVIRSKAYETLFGCTPSSAFPAHMFFKTEDEPYLIDVFVYTLDTGSREIEAAVTNGMSDQRMVDAEDSARWSRRELIQYFPKCTEGHARRLHDMAWAPFCDEFLLESHNTMAWHRSAIEGTPWKNAFFLAPLIKSHREFQFEIEGDPVTLLWHIPISDAERAYKIEHGAEALIDRLDAVELPWVFDEANRTPLVD